MQTIAKKSTAREEMRMRARDCAIIWSKGQALATVDPVPSFAWNHIEAIGANIVHTKASLDVLHTPPKRSCWRHGMRRKRRICTILAIENVRCTVNPYGLGKKKDMDGICSQG
jgi:hypothetical protein